MSRRMKLSLLLFLIGAVYVLEALELADRELRAAIHREVATRGQDLDGGLALAQERFGRKL